MKLSRLLLFLLFIIPLPVERTAPGRELLPEVFLGPLEAQVGISPLTGHPSGWYTSDVTIHVIAPANVLANGQPVQDGRLTISDEGRHRITLQPGPLGEENAVTQIVNIDRTAPLVSWITEQNAILSGVDAISAVITDATSGICTIESSYDNGRSWEIQLYDPLAGGDVQVAHEITWSAHGAFADFPSGTRLVLLRSRDCAGNTSPAVVLVIRIE
jgi:hypothetical protein